MGNVVWKLLGSGSAILAGIVANKVITEVWKLSLIHISEPTRPCGTSRMPSSA